MKVVVAGASGLIGSALVPELRRAGHEVLRLVRRAAQAADEIRWHPDAGDLETGRLEGIGGVVNLAGENVGARRWTAERREQILRSRIEATGTLVKAVSNLVQRPEVFLSASAVGFYGDRGDEILGEDSARGGGFLPEVCRAWEHEAQRVANVGVRPVCLRFGVVLSREGGALPRMLPLFRCGLGGRLGSGRQWMSWVSIDDVVDAIRYSLEAGQVRGPVNIVAPEPVTNVEFTRELGRALGRPAWLPVPAFALRAVVGRGMADEALLGSTRAMPEKLGQAGYAFRHRRLDAALRDILR